MMRGLSTSTYGRISHSSRTPLDGLRLSGLGYLLYLGEYGVSICS